MSRSVAVRYLSFRVIALVAMFNTLVQPWTPSIQAAEHTAGKWSTSQDWTTGTGFPISLNLVRGDGAPFHSRIRWWSHDLPVTHGGDYGWRPNFGTCATYPDTSILFELPPDSSGIDIFCAGATTLASGALFVAGGNNPETDTWGEKRARIWTPGQGRNPGSWATPGDMSEWRWYASATSLASGEVLVLGGNQHPKFAVAMGKRSSGLPTAPVIDSVRLFSPVSGGQWENAVLPDADPDATPGRPPGRWLHTATQMEITDGFEGQVYFGGTDDQSTFSDAWQLVRDWNKTGGDFIYQWRKIFLASGSPTPPQRREHSAIGATLPGGTNEKTANVVVFGGIDQSNAISNNTYRLRKKNSSYEWGTVSIGTSTPPSARFGHAAIYDENTISGPPATKRMIVFGGATSTSGTVADNDVYELRFGSTPGTGTWSVMQEVDIDGSGRPSARFGHSMAIDDRLYTNSVTTVSNGTKHGHIAYMFGGKTGASTFAAADQIWLLWLFDDDTYGWQLQDHYTSGDVFRPSQRTHATMVATSAQGYGEGTRKVRLYLYGGETASGINDKYVYVLDPLAPTSTSYGPAWSRWAASDVALAGASAIMDRFPGGIARVGDLFNPASGTSGTFTRQNNLKLYPAQYPPTFLVSGGNTAAGRVVTMSWDGDLYYTDVTSGGASPTWTKFSQPGSKLIRSSEPAVMYEPGKVMVADFIADDVLDDFVHGSRTRVIDVTQPATATWASGAPDEGTGALIPRRFHNLVLLPNGQVMAVGGVKSFNSNHFDLAVKHPQIWDPSTSSWTPETQLDEQPHMRNYHSTAILLPDGRVLSSGGDGDGQTHMRTAEIYCPPYLFDSNDQLAVRPNLISATGRWRYGAEVTFSIAAGGSSSDTTIRRVCLIRAPATTHAYDESQRYIPLPLVSVSERSDHIRNYVVTAPADSFIAPPGDYLLFASSAAGVPSVARWVRVGSNLANQYDVSGPSEVTPTAEFITCTGVGDIALVAGGDDGSTGTALAYDVRYSFSPITSSNFTSASVMGAPPPALAGSHQTGGGLSGLQPGTTIYLAARASDKMGNLSSISYSQFATLSSQVICGGGGGGFGESMTRSRDGAAGSPRGQRGFAEPSQMSATQTSLRLVGECAGGSSIRWQITARDLSDEPEVLAATVSRMLVQDAAVDGGWVTRESQTVQPGLVGVRALAEPGRVVFPAGASIDAIELEPKAYDCSAADHSRLGDLQDTVATAEVPQLAPGDTLTLDYVRDAAASGNAGEDCFYLIRIPDPVGHTRIVGRPPGHAVVDLPVAFALRGARPNPAAGSTTIHFDLPHASPVRIELFDVQGRRAVTLVDGLIQAGRQTAVWDGRLENGVHAAAGVYLCRMTAGAFMSEKTVTLLP